ncbi:MAG: hypothetical protein J2P15_06685 [Micromonosporaceae bacterium]|nr:hypothetical protein [Micromonosporaceae bacterium]
MYPEQQPPYPGEQQPYQQQPPYQPPQQPYPGPAYPQQEYPQPEYYPGYGGQPPVSAPPPATAMPPTSAVPTSVPPTSVPPGYPSLAMPGTGATGQPRRNNTPMIIITAALGLVTVVSLVLVLVTINGLHGDIAAARADLTARQAAAAQARAKLQDDFQKADLQNKLAQVQALTSAAREALIAWGNSQNSATIKTVQDAINKCDAAVLDYDAAAAEFPADILGNLPGKIDTTNPDTDCSRINGS